MEIGLADVAVAADAVPTVQVIGIPIVIVVYTIEGDFPGVAPQIGPDIRVGGIQPVVNDTDDDGIVAGGDATRGNVPGAGHIQVHTGGTP